MELEFTKLKFQPGKFFLNGTQVYYTRVPRQYTSCNFLFFPSRITTSLSLSLSNVILSPSSSSISSVLHLPQSLVSLNASSLRLFYLLHHCVIPYFLLNGQRPLNDCDKCRHSIRKQGKLDLFYCTYLRNLLGFCCKYGLCSE